MTRPLHRLTIDDLARRIARRELSPTELTEHVLRRIEAENPRLNAFTTVAGDEALATARELTEEIARGRYRGPLHGIPVAIKDLTDTAGLRTTYGSALFRDHVPSADAEPVTRLRAAGAVIVGKTNTHEFAFGTTTDNPHFGATHNPWRRGHVPGGSSGGSGAAVAAHLVPLATGTDTGGSIRIPAAACGCVGIKPTFGRVSLRGTFPLASSLDHVGPLARTARDCAIALRVLAGFDPDDPWSREWPSEDFTRELDRASLRGVRVGVAPAFRPLPLAPAIVESFERAVRAAGHLGADLVEVALPDATDATVAASMILLAESYAHHAARLATDRSSYGDDVREQLDASAAVDATSLVRALHARESVARRMARLFGDRIDVLLLPTMAITAPVIGAKEVTLGDAAVAVAPAMASYTLLANLTRMPAVAIPTGLAGDGLPVSIQIIGPHGADAGVLGIADVLERALWPQSERRPADAATPD